MVSGTWVVFRIPPPLYALNGSAVTIPGVPELGTLVVTVQIVDSGAPLNAQISGGTIAPGNDNYGLFHHSQITVHKVGEAADWMRWGDMEAVLETACNRVIDWYRHLAGQPLVRRLPGGTIRGFYAHDTNANFGLIGMPFVTSLPSATAPPGNQTVIAELRERLNAGQQVSLWTVLHMDAPAELAGSSLRTAVLLTNTGLETLANSAFRAVASADEIEARFGGDRGPGFRSLLRDVNNRAPTGLSNTKLLELVDRASVYRDEIVHGNPIVPRHAEVEKAVAALGEIINLVVPAVRNVRAPSK